jgi:hypothetical protein
MNQIKPALWTPSTGTLTMSDGTQMTSKDDIHWTAKKFDPAVDVAHYFAGNSGQCVALFADGHWNGHINGLPLKTEQIDLESIDIEAGRAVAKDGHMFLSVDNINWWPCDPNEPEVERVSEAEQALREELATAHRGLANYKLALAAQTHNYGVTNLRLIAAEQRNAELIALLRRCNTNLIASKDSAVELKLDTPISDRLRLDVEAALNKPDLAKS